MKRFWISAGATLAALILVIGVCVAVLGRGDRGNDATTTTTTTSFSGIELPPDRFD